MEGSIEPLISPQPPAPPPAKKRTFILGGFGVALGLFLAYFRAWAWSYGMMTSEAWGYAIGAALLPALIAYAIAGRKSVRNFTRFGVWFSGLSLFFSLLSGGTPVSLTQHIGNLMKEAAGTRPGDNNGPSDLDEVVRAMMRGMLEDRKTFDQETAVFNVELGRLYSVETYSSRTAMQRSIDAVRGIVAADQRYSKQIETLPDRVQTIVNRSSLSDADKRDFMTGMRKSFGSDKVLQIRRQAMETEARWGDATVALYTFAMANATKLYVEGDHLVIANERIRNELNDRVNVSEKLRKDVAALNTKMESAQRAALQEAGLTFKDLGLKESDQADKK